LALKLVDGSALPDGGGNAAAVGSGERVCVQAAMMNAAAGSRTIDLMSMIRLP
jgi:hypothetical protein